MNKTIERHETHDWSFTRNADGSVTLISAAHVAAGSGKWERARITLTHEEWAAVVAALSVEELSAGRETDNWWMPDTRKERP